METLFGHRIRGRTSRVTGDWGDWNRPPLRRRQRSALLHQAPQQSWSVGDRHDSGDRPTPIRHLDHLAVAHTIDHPRRVLVQLPEADLLHFGIVGQKLLHGCGWPGSGRVSGLGGIRFRRSGGFQIPRHRGRGGPPSGRGSFSGLDHGRRAGRGPGSPPWRRQRLRSNSRPLPPSRSPAQPRREVG